jgi:protein phosphatase
MTGLRWGAATDVGRLRSVNEDSVLTASPLFAVADGMGGHAGGDVASNLAIETFAKAFQEGKFDANLESGTDVPRRGSEIACAIQMANAAVYERAQSDDALTDMGTTLVSARFSPNKQRVYIGHVGDSRCYRIRGGVIRQLTNDHTLRGLGIKGPTSHQLYQAIGLKGRITIDVIVDKPRANDLYVLCSDGLTKMMNDEEIRDLALAETDLQTSVKALIDLANDRGGKDNVTVIMVKVLEKVPSKSLRP